MKEMPIEKRLEVARYYLLGYTYQEIEAASGASHGTIANIVQELEGGKLVIPGTPSDQVNDLRVLSLDLKKKGLQPSEALLGVTLFHRLQDLGIAPEQLDSWSGLLKEFAQPDFSPKDFLGVALALHNLEKSRGKPFETLAEEYAKLGEGVDKLKIEADSLGKKRAELSSEVEPLKSQVQALEKNRSALEEDVKKEMARLQELKLKVKEAGEVKAQLSKESKELESKKAKLSADVDGKEDSLKKLNSIGLSDEDLLRLRAFIEKTAKNEGISGNQVRERFFWALTLFEDVSGLEKQRKVEAEKVGQLAKEQATLSGEISQLEKRKGVLEGEMNSSIATISQKIKDVGTGAASQLEQQVADIREQLDGVLADALKAGETVGEMQQLVRKGEESGKSLANFVQEIRVRVAGKNGGG